MGRSGPEYVAVGLVLGAFGARGWVRVRPLTDFPGRLLELEKVRVRRAGPLAAGTEWRRVVWGEERGDGGYVLEIEGVTSREQAAGLRGALLEIPAGEVKPLPPGRFYRFQVLGLEVRDEAGRLLGRVRDILETGSNDVYVVAPEGAAGPRDEILVPALKEVVLKLDPGAGEMVVRLPRGWDDDREV